MEDNKTKEEILRRHIAEFEGEDCTDKVWDEMTAEDGIAMPILKAMEVHTQQSTKHLQDELNLKDQRIAELERVAMNLLKAVVDSGMAVDERVEMFNLLNTKS